MRFFSNRFVRIIAWHVVFVISVGTGRIYGADAPASQLVTYPLPEGVAQNHDFGVWVRPPGGEWREITPYNIKVDVVKANGHNPLDTSMAYFDFSGSVEVGIVSNRGPVESVRIRPLSYGIKPEMQVDRFSFTLSQPRNLSIEVNGDIFHNLQLFANPIDTNPPDPKDPNVQYFGPGVHEVGRLSIPSNKTVYIAGGAVLRGSIQINRAENVRVLGHGVIDQAVGGLRIANSSNVEINGLIGRQFFTGGSRNVTIRNCKCISYVGNGDGMNVICSSDVLLDGVFNRNSDDCMTVYATRSGFTGGSRNITLQNSTLWADVAHPILVGTHGNTPNPETIENLVFQNIDILDHNEAQINYQGCMALNAGDSNLIRNVRFENIRVEDFRQGQLVNLRVFFNRKYCTSPGRGIENVLFKDITYNGTHADESTIYGYDETRAVKNVVFENLRINGKLISDDLVEPYWFVTADLARFSVGEHVEGLVFRAAAPASQPATAPRP